MMLVLTGAFAHALIDNVVPPLITVNLCWGVMSWHESISARRPGADMLTAAGAAWCRCLAGLLSQMMLTQMQVRLWQG